MIPLTSYGIMTFVRTVEVDGLSYIAVERLQTWSRISSGWTKRRSQEFSDQQPRKAKRRQEGRKGSLTHRPCLVAVCGTPVKSNIVSSFFVASARTTRGHLLFQSVKEVAKKNESDNKAAPEVRGPQSEGTKVENPQEKGPDVKRTQCLEFLRFVCLSFTSYLH